MDSRVIRVNTLNTVFDQFIRDDLEHAKGEWTLDRVKILTNMLKMKLESRSEDMEQSMVVSSNQEEKGDESVLDEIKVTELKSSNASETLTSLNKLAVAINKLNKYVTSLKEIASNSPKKADKLPQNITVNIVPQTPLKNQPVQLFNSLTPRRRTPFKETGNAENDRFMQELFNDPVLSGILDNFATNLTADLIGDLMHDDGSSSHASTPGSIIDPGDNSDFNSTLTAATVSGASLTTPNEVFRKPPIERHTPSANSSQGNPVKNLMNELRTPEKHGKGHHDMSSPLSSPYVPCSSPCPEPVAESPVKFVIPDFNSLTASPMQPSVMLSSAPRPVFIVQQSLPQKQKIPNQQQQQQLGNQLQFVNSTIVNPITAHQVVSGVQSVGRKIAPKLPGVPVTQVSSGVKIISPLKARSRKAAVTTKKVKKVDPSEIEKAIKEIEVTSKNVNAPQSKRKMSGSSGTTLKRFVKLNPGTTTGINSSPESHRLVIDEGKIVQRMDVQSTSGSMATLPTTTGSTTLGQTTTILSSSFINPSANSSQCSVVNVNELCDDKTMDILKGLPTNPQKLDELLHKVHNKNSKK